MASADPSSDDAPSALQASPALTAALRRLLRPLVRLLLRRNVTYPYLSELLKGLFVEVARDDLPLAGKRQTDSRLSLLTGVHRKDVRRLQRESGANEPTPAHISFGGRLIARWNGDPVYLDADGQPRTLPRRDPGDGSPSFERLVSEESKDIRAGVVLREWMRLGLVEINADDRVQLRSGGYVPALGDDEKLFFLGRNVRDHLATAVHNVLGEQPPLLERSVFADGLDAQAVTRLAESAERLGMDMLRTLNQQARELKQKPPGEPPGTHRMTLGLYFHAEARPAPRTAESPPETDDAA